MEELSKIINHKIKESDLYKEYIFYKNQIDNNEIICKQKEELDRNSVVSEINGSFSAVVLSRRGIVIQ